MLVTLKLCSLAIGLAVRDDPPLEQLSEILETALTYPSVPIGRRVALIRRTGLITGHKFCAAELTMVAIIVR